MATTSADFPHQGRVDPDVASQFPEHGSGDHRRPSQSFLPETVPTDLHYHSNRYLWTCVPSTSIDDLPYEKQPHGYGLSVSIFGKYGVGFAQWCLDNGFGYIDVDEDLQFANWYQTLGLGARDGWRYVYTRTLQLQHDLSKSADPQPDGQEVKDFVQDLKSKDGRSVRDIAKMTNLTEREVQELMGDTGGWYGWG